MSKGCKPRQEPQPAADCSLLCMASFGSAQSQARCIPGYPARPALPPAHSSKSRGVSSSVAAYGDLRCPGSDCPGGTLKFQVRALPVRYLRQATGPLANPCLTSCPPSCAPAFRLPPSAFHAWLSLWAWALRPNLLLPLVRSDVPPSVRSFFRRRLQCQ